MLWPEEVQRGPQDSTGPRSSTEKTGLGAGSEQSDWRFPISLNLGFLLLRTPSLSSFTSLQFTLAQLRYHLLQEALPPGKGLQLAPEPCLVQPGKGPGPGWVRDWSTCNNPPSPWEILTPQPPLPDSALCGLGEKRRVNRDRRTVGVVGGLESWVRIPVPLFIHHIPSPLCATVSSSL